MNWDNNREIAHRIAAESNLDFENVLRKLEAGGEGREIAISLLRMSEHAHEARELISEARRCIRRAQVGF